MRRELLQDSRFRRVISAAALLIGGFGIVYLFRKSIVADWSDVDFIYIWLSGHLWSQGISPYGVEFIEQGSILFDIFNGQAFFYPPSFWFISRIFATFEYQTAVEVWRWTSVSLLLLSSLLLKAGMGNAGIKISWPTIIFYTGLVSFMQGTVLTFVLGQTSIVIYFAVCLVIYSALSRNNILLAVGLCLVLLKPNVGAGLFIAFLPFAIYRKSVVLTVFGSLLMSLPALLPFGVINTIISYLTGISEHSGYIANQAQLTTGIRNIFYHLTDIEMSSTLAVLITVLGILMTMIVIAKTSILMKEGQENEKVLFILALSLSMIGFLAPLHVYDFMFVAPVILLTQKLGKYTQVVIFVSFLVIARSQNITFEAGIFRPHYPNLWAGSELSTMASFFNTVLIFVVAKNLYMRHAENT